jgi:two-component system sensor histidine kinase/response regulator
VVVGSVGVDIDIPVLDGIDTANGLARTQGNRELYLKLLRRFRVSQQSFGSEFDAAVASADWELALRMAHTLKGLAGSIGANALQQACDTLEAQALEQRAERDARDLGVSELTRVLTALAAVNDAETGSGEVESGAADVRVILAELVQQLGNFDTSALDTVERHRTLLSTGPSAALFESLESALGDFDMLAARDVAEKMLGSD